MARILSGDPRYGPLAGGWSPDFSEASPNAMLQGGNPMAVDPRGVLAASGRLGILDEALQGAAARYRVAQPVGTDPTYLHDLGRGYAGPLGGVVGDLVTPPDFNTGDPWQDGLNAGMMVGMPIKAFHGSPHDFNAFDMSKIGTGEGAQVYGHGLYFAENPAVATQYKKDLSNMRLSKAQRALDAFGGDTDNAIAGLRSEIDRLQNLPNAGGDAARRDRFIADKEASISELQHLKSTGRMSTGKTYEVSINADPEHFLDWDKPLSEQPKAVQEAFGKIVDRDISKESGWANLTGEKALNAVAERHGARAGASEALRAAGIKGIRYKDQGSRAWFEVEPHEFNNGDPGWKVNGPRGDQVFDTKAEAQQFADGLNKGKEKPTHNYVVFDDKIIDILKKYGIAGLTAGGAAATGILSGQQQQPGT